MDIISKLHTLKNYQHQLYIHQRLNFEILIVNKICNFINLYRRPSQNQDDFQAFIDNLGMNLETLAQKYPS